MGYLTFPSDVVVEDCSPKGSPPPIHLSQRGRVYFSIHSRTYPTGFSGMTLRQKVGKDNSTYVEGNCGYSYVILVKVLVRGLSTERDP